ncbi:MAG: hypothetical protein JF606_18050 [Burkholderiales bacterium]|nr:hypothetical protein [Burkholderiales bacterium]
MDTTSLTLEQFEHLSCRTKCGLARRSFSATRGLRFSSTVAACRKKRRITSPRLNVQKFPFLEGTPALSANTSITSLDLSGNNIWAVGRQALEAVRHRFQTLLL